MTGSSYSQSQPWSIACVIAKKRPQSTQSGLWDHRTGGRRHSLLDATSTALWCLVNPIAAKKVGLLGVSKNSASGDLDCRTDLGSEAWVNNAFRQGYESSESIRPEK